MAADLNGQLFRRVRNKCYYNCSKHKEHISSGGPAPSLATELARRKIRCPLLFLFHFSFLPAKTAIPHADPDVGVPKMHGRDVLYRV